MTEAPQEAQEPKILYSREEAAKQLSMSDTMLYRLGQEGKIAYIKVGGRVFYAPEDLQAFVAAHRVPCQP